MIYSYANVDQSALDAIQSLEKKIGAPLIAMEKLDVAPAPVEGADLDRIKELENELGVVLVAVQ